MIKSHKRDKFYPYRKKLGLRIKQLRHEREMTQEDLAFKIDINVSYLAKIENGYVNTSLRYLIRIALGLNTQVRNLIDF